MKGVAVLLATALAATLVAGTELTPENFDAEVFGGKNAFIKFQAPWWGHCKRMKPDWDRLMEEHQGSPSVTVGDVDCTQHQELCSKHGVSGYPTIKYWLAGDDEGKAYNKGRDFDALSAFVSDELAPPCSVAEPEKNCDERQQKFIAAMKAKDASEVAKQLARLEGMKDTKAKPDLKKWIGQRIAILKQMADA